MSNLEDLFRDYSKNMTVKPKAKSWSRLEAKLSHKHKPFRFAYIGQIAIAVILILILLMAYWVLAHKQKSTLPIQVKNEMIKIDTLVPDSIIKK